ASFLGAFVGHVVGGPMKAMIKGKDAAAVAARTVSAAIVGGVSAVAGGGKFANGAVSAAFTHLFNNEMTANKGSIQISDAEREYAAKGERFGFWMSRFLKGDPFAPTGLMVATNDGLAAWGANSIGMAFNSFSHEKLTALGVDLMRTYVKYVDADYLDMNAGNWRGVLSNDQITQWHHEVFPKNNIPKYAYPGTYILNRYDSFICKGGCDGYSP
ncbi:MAG: hypothetical protein RPU60_11365, partial [Candidatus Sedimenticola sp. (ex Thyasira tokunagai)]